MTRFPGPLFFLLFLAAVWVCGCGYTTSSLLPPELESIHVSNFVNKIDTARVISDKRPVYLYYPGLENEITRTVINKFIYDRALDIKSEKKASLLLNGTLVDLRYEPVSYDTDRDVEEFRVEIMVNIELYNQLTGKLMWKEDSFMGESYYTITGPNAKSDSTALAEAVNDLAQRILERTVEMW